jgi:hypothetical protein
MTAPASTDLTQPRSTGEVLSAALGLYRLYPLQFAALAAAVVVPYWLIVLAVADASPFGQQHASTGTALTLALVDLVIVGPFVSALHVDAVAMIGEGRVPRLTRIATVGMRALPVVAAAQIMAGIAIVMGLFLLIVPGILLALRFSVVAQVPAVERTSWIDALRRSGELARGSYGHIFGLLFLLFVISSAVTYIGEQLAGTSTHPGPVAIGIVAEALIRSFTALATAVLYFDLRARIRGLAT